MDMSMTRAVATIIQAVSPVSSFGAAAGAAGAASATAAAGAGASSANAGKLMHNSAVISIMMLINFFMIIPPC
jgi:hypothetical protein